MLRDRPELIRVPQVGDRLCRWIRAREHHYRGVTGYACRGLQLFWPISPTHSILLFDRAVYKVGRADHGVRVTTLANERDIAQLNSLQVLNAHENVYFKGAGPRTDAELQCLALPSQRLKGRLVFVETEGVGAEDGGTQALLHNFESLLPLQLTVSAIKARKQALTIPLHERGNLYRSLADRLEQRSGTHESMPAGIYRAKKTTRK